MDAELILLEKALTSDKEELSPGSDESEEINKITVT